MLVMLVLILNAILKFECRNGTWFPLDECHFCWHALRLRLKLRYTIIKKDAIEKHICVRNDF